MSNTTPTTVPNLAGNAFAGYATPSSGSSAAAPATGNTSWYGLTNPDLNVVVGTAPPGPWSQQDSGSGPQPDLDPFGLGMPIPTDLAGTGYTVGQMVQYLMALTPAQISQVQAELANAGYYGALNSITSEPTWGTLGQNDFTAIGRFAKDVIAGVQNGSTPSSVLAASTAQWSTTQQNQSSLTPVKDLGKNYTIANLDPNEAGTMVDQTSLKTLGHTLSDADRQRLSGWMNDLYTSRQRAVDQGDIAQNTMNAQAQAQASDFIDPVTGRAIDHNGVTSAARSQLGVSYQWGAQQPGKAFDCSGLTQWVYGQNGISIPRRSQEQWSDPHGHNFNDMSQASPGDLVFFGGDGTGPTHVGIYIGNGMMIDAPHTGAQVELDNVQSFASADALVGFKHYDQVGNTTIAATNLPPGSTSAGSPSKEQFAADVLAGLGAPTNTSNMAAMIGWMNREDGSNGALARYNPLNTTYGGSDVNTSGSINGVGVKGYASYQDGLKATIDTLQSSYYHDIVGALQAGNGSQALSAGTPSLGTWSGGGYTSLAPEISSATAAANAWVSSGGKAGAPATMDANGGRSILSTPNTFTNTTDYSTAALQTSLEAQLRAENPAQAQAHDMTSAYTMLAKSLRDGITVNNA